MQEIDIAYRFSRESPKGSVVFNLYLLRYDGTIILPKIASRELSKEERTLKVTPINIGRVIDDIWLSPELKYISHLDWDHAYPIVHGKINLNLERAVINQRLAT